jgi:hypothetical protein
MSCSLQRTSVEQKREMSLHFRLWSYSWFKYVYLTTARDAFALLVAAALALFASAALALFASAALASAAPAAATLGA